MSKDFIPKTTLDDAGNFAAQNNIDKGAPNKKIIIYAVIALVIFALLAFAAWYFWSVREDLSLEEKREKLRLLRENSPATNLLPEEKRDTLRGLGDVEKTQLDEGAKLDTLRSLRQQ